MKHPMGLDAVELVMLCEEAFGIRIEDPDVQSAHTVGRLFDVIVRSARRVSPQQRDGLTCTRCQYPLRKLTCLCCPECGLVVPGDPNDTGWEQRCWELLAYVVHEYTGIEPDAVTRDAHFVNDLGF